MPKLPPRGRRAAPPSNPSNQSTGITFGNEGKAPVAVEDGVYLLQCEGARHQPTTKGGHVVIPVLVDPETGDTIRVAPILVGSLGGVSDFVLQGRRTLATMAGLADGEQVGLDDLLQRLAGRTVEVELRLFTDDRTGLDTNRITDAYPVEGDA